MKTRIVILLCFVLLVSKAFAQPGYMGHKISLGYNFEIFPSFGFLSDRRSEHPQNRTVFTTGHHYNASLVVSRRLELVADYGIRIAKMFCHDQFFTIQEDEWNYNSIYFQPKEYFVKGREQIMQLSLRFYRDGYIAPIGTFFQCSLGYLTANYHPDVKSLIGYNEVYDGNSTKHERVSIPLNNVEDRKYVRMSYGIGNKKVLFSTVFLTTSCNMNILMGMGNKVKEELSSTYYGEDNGAFDTYANDILIKGVRWSSWLDVSVGLGFMF